VSDTVASAADLARQLYAALAAGDDAELARLLSPDFHGVVTAGLGLGIGGEHAGPEAMREEVWWAIGRRWAVRAEPDAFHLLDDGRLFVDGHYRGKGRRSGTPISARFIHVITVEGGRITRLEQLTDSALFRDALAPEELFETIRLTVRDGVAHLRLDRPEAANAIDLRMAQETLAAARLIEADDRVRAVLISGEGSSLTVGGDIGYFLDSSEPGAHGDLFARMTRPFHDAFRILERIDAPIVTAVRGSVAGGGLGFVYAADLVLATPESRFVTAFAGIGLSGDGGGTYHLPRLVGPRKARELYLLNRPLSAAEALDAGLVNELVDDAELDQRAAELASRLAGGPTRAFGRMRRLLSTTWDRDLSQQLLEETHGVALTGDTKDAAEGIAAFRDKRPAIFEGR
jgi:2-(1,2-epoxy-1,2-dihydrophenyl)acetyl-CoA isomerase